VIVECEDASMDDVAVGSVLRQIRHRLHLRQQDVAARASNSRSLLSRIEHGDLSATSLTNVRRVGRALEATVELQVRCVGRRRGYADESSSFWPPTSDFSAPPSPSEATE
jgi:transcriptional regulator with XRE-family HTH domain